MPGHAALLSAPVTIFACCDSKTEGAILLQKYTETPNFIDQQLPK
jgi:hypothetical protein